MPPSKARSGNGSAMGKPKSIDEQAQHFTVDALTRIGQIIRTSDDEKTALAAARYMLDIAWGRPSTRPLANNAEKETEQGEHSQLVEQLYQELEKLSHPKKQGPTNKAPIKPTTHN